MYTKDSYRQTHKALFIMVQAVLRKEAQFVITNTTSGVQI